MERYVAAHNTPPGSRTVRTFGLDALEKGAHAGRFPNPDEEEEASQSRRRSAPRTASCPAAPTPRPKRKVSTAASDPSSSTSEFFDIEDFFGPHDFWHKIATWQNGYDLRRKNRSRGWTCPAENLREIEPRRDLAIFLLPPVHVDILLAAQGGYPVPVDPGSASGRMNCLPTI